MYESINWYTQRFPFPQRGWKYAQSLLYHFGLGKKTYRKKLFNGLLMNVNATDHIQKSIFWYGAYEKNVSLFWQRLVQEDSVVLDIGANIGYFSLLAAAKAKKGKVFSMEPVSAFRKCLKENLALNALTNVTVLPYCVSDESGWTEIFLAESDNLGMSGLTPSENFSGKKERVECIVVDDWRRQNAIPKIQLLKIDIEGAEKKALAGMAGLLQTDQPIVLIEIIESLLQNFESSAADVYALLQRHQYTPYEILSPVLLKKISAPKDGYDIVFLPHKQTLPAGINCID